MPSHLFRATIISSPVRWRGDQDLIIGRVLAGKLHREGKPMVHIRKNGLTY